MKDKSRINDSFIPREEIISRQFEFIENFNFNQDYFMIPTS